MKADRCAKSAAELHWRLGESFTLLPSSSAKSSRQVSENGDIAEKHARLSLHTVALPDYNH